MKDLPLQLILRADTEKERRRENIGLYGTVFYLKNPTPPGAAHAT